jgi:D-glycero-beta-D-manno-heptose 1-phosphate adenylyltransferase
VNFRDKIIAWADLPAWRERVRAAGKKLAVTNGCFDILHPGHVAYLQTARNHGDALLVGVNADASVRANKGPQRPVNSEADRAEVLAALASVDGVCIFTDRTAANFLAQAKPDVYVKGGDQNLTTVPPEELRIVKECGGQVVFAEFVRGKSTTALLEKISRL